MTSPAVTGTEQGMTPVLVLPWVRNKVVKSLVNAEKVGGGIAPLKRTMAIFCVVPDARQFTPVIVKLHGAVNQYPLALEENVDDSGVSGVVAEPPPPDWDSA